MKAVDEFVSTNEIVERIKDAISTKVGNKKVFDQDVADLLNIPRKSFGCVKKRGYPIFYLEVIKLCYRTGLDPMKLLF
jgi:hypothetical protein